MVLGHASGAFTLDVYSHVLPHMQEEAAAKVEAALMGGLPERRDSVPKSGDAASEAARP
jgi:hypothetical protein